MNRPVWTSLLRACRALPRTYCTSNPPPPRPPPPPPSPSSSSTPTSEAHSMSQQKKKKKKSKKDEKLTRWIGQTPLHERLHPNQKNAVLDSQRGVEMFLDIENSAGARRTGRAWRTSELRLKSFDDLHRLWYILLKERNVLLTEKAWCKTNGRYWSNGVSNVAKVRTSMARIKTVVAERLRADRKRRELHGEDTGGRYVKALMTTDPETEEETVDNNEDGGNGEEKSESHVKKSEEKEKEGMNSDGSTTSPRT